MGVWREGRACRPSSTLNGRRKRTVLREQSVADNSSGNPSASVRTAASIWPLTILCCKVLERPVSNSKVASGAACRAVCKKPGRKRTAAVVMNPSLKCPISASFGRQSSTSPSSLCSNACAWPTTVRPMGVKRGGRTDLSNNCTASSLSSAFICMDSAGSVMFNCSAAFANDPTVEILTRLRNVRVCISSQFLNLVLNLIMLF